MAKFYIFLFILGTAFTGFSQDDKSKEKSQDQDKVMVKDPKTFFFKTFPTIKAKIGTKEGVHLDQRYYVYQDFKRGDGSIKSKRMGVVRAGNAADNTTDPEATTKFYQISGAQLDEAMYLKKKEDVGIGVSFALCQPMSHATAIQFDDEYGNQQVIDNNGNDLIYFIMDYNISPLISKLIKKPFFSEVRFCAGIAGIDFRNNIQGTLQWNNITDKVETIGGSSGNPLKPTVYLYKIFGLSKDIHLRRNIKLVPFYNFFLGVENYNCLGVHVNVTLYKGFSYNMGFRFFYGYRPTADNFNVAEKDRKYFLKSYVDLIGFRFFF